MNFKVINELATEVHQNAVNKGFWEENNSDEHCLCLVISELMEAVEAHRKDRHANKKLFNRIMDGQETGFYITFSNCIKDTVEDEIADAFIRLLDLAGEYKYILDPVPLVVNLVEDYNSFTENIYAIIRVIILSDNKINQCRFAIHEIIRLAEILGFDLEWHVRQKMRYNSLREYKHGKAY